MSLPLASDLEFGFMAVGEAQVQAFDTKQP